MSANEDAVAQRVVLTDGKTYALRPLHPDDETPLQEFFKSHTAQTIYERYGHMISSMTWRRAHELVTVNQSRDPAWVISEKLAHGTEKFHAVGRYYDEGDGSAEFAVVVHEGSRRLGMAATLMRHLIKLAAQRGIHRLWGQVLHGNMAMAAMCRRLGFHPGKSSAEALVFEINPVHALKQFENAQGSGRRGKSDG